MFEYTLTLYGMRCGACEAHVNDVVRRNFAVRKVSSSHRKNKTIIRCREPLDLEELKRVIGATGYQLQKVEVREL